MVTLDAGDQHLAAATIDFEPREPVAIRQHRRNQRVVGIALHRDRRALQRLAGDMHEDLDRNHVNFLQGAAYTSRPLFLYRIINNR